MGCMKSSGVEHDNEIHVNSMLKIIGPSENQVIVNTVTSRQSLISNYSPDRLLWLVWRPTDNMIVLSRI